MGNRKKTPTPKQGSPAWMSTWADMVSLLMCFFVLLFSLSNVDEARFQEFADAMASRRVFFGGALGTIFSDSGGIMPDQSLQLPLTMDSNISEDYGDVVTEIVTRRNEMMDLAETFRTYMAPYGALMHSDIGITVDELGEYVRITFESGMLFDSGQAVLRPEAIETIDHVASFLIQYPEHRVVVQGHTDNVPINTLQFPSNFHLSAARSISVMQRMMYYHDFDPWMVSAEGLGEYRPVDVNYTAEGRANNRRVEILVFARQQGQTTLID